MRRDLTGFTGRLARRSAERPRRTIAVWLAAVVVSLALAATLLHGLTTTGRAVGSPGSVRAAQAIRRAFPRLDLAAHGDVIVVRSARAVAGSPRFDHAVLQLVHRVAAQPGVTRVQADLARDGGMVSADGHAALIRFAVRSTGAVKPVDALVRQVNGNDGLQAGLTGTDVVNNDVNTLSQRDLSHGELGIGLPAALIVLVLVFGAVIAGLVPVVLALISIIVGIGVIALLSQAFSLSSFVINMLSGMGLALGIDYSLFVLSRVREERRAGRGTLDAIEQAGARASRAVLFSGGTFVIAMSGMLIVRTSVMRSLAAGAMVVGITTVAAALTLLPALLSLLGDRVEALRLPSLRLPSLRRPRAAASSVRGSAESRFWSGVITRVLRRPALSLTLSAGLLLLAAVPVLGLHIGANGVSTLPRDMSSRQGAALLARSFPDANPYPVQIVAVGGGRRARVDLLALRARLSQDARFGPATVSAAPAHRTLLLSAPVTGDPVAPPAIAAVRSLRGDLIPHAFAGSGAQVYVGGQTAQDVDYFDAVTNPTPIVLAFVLGLSFLVLLVAFRSLLIPLVSIVLNLLSVGAAYGLLTLVFIHGVGASVFGFERAHVIEAWVPLFLFSVLFGLSMDYQVFLMSRIKERHDAGENTREAVRSGVASTARIITGAALIIIVVFIGFASGQLIMFQQMGFGIAIALLLDATVIRSVVLPSLLVLIGDRVWAMPGWLGWVPDVGVEQSTRARSALLR